MAKLVVFNQVSLDGYFVDASGDMRWAHKQDAEWNAFAANNAGGDGALVFGRITYEMMARFWPTEAARKANAAVAKGMNEKEKFVFSRSLRKPTWQNTTVLKGDAAVQLRKLKKTSKTDLVILGSGSLIPPLTEAGLIDVFQLVLNPIVLGGGRTLFEGLPDPVNLKLKETRAFKNGNVVLTYGAASA